MQPQELSREYCSRETTRAGDDTFFNGDSAVTFSHVDNVQVRYSLPSDGALAKRFGE